MKVYLDTCILSRLVDLRVKDSQLDALEFIASYEPVKLVTSPKTLEEFSKVNNPERRKSLIVLFRIIEKVYTVPPVRKYSPLFGDMPWGVPFGSSGKLVEPPYDGLRKIFDDSDASHVYFAYKSGCDYFLTLDQTTIVEVANNNLTKVDSLVNPMKIVNPVQLQSQLHRRKSIFQRQTSS